MEQVLLFFLPVCLCDATNFPECFQNRFAVSFHLQLKLHLPAHLTGQLFLACISDDMPLMQDNDAVAHRLNLRQNMGGQQHRPGFGKLTDQLADFDNLRRVQSNRRLIQNQQLRVAHQRLRQSHPLTVALGKISYHSLGHLFDFHQLHDLLQILLLCLFDVGILFHLF